MAEFIQDELLEAVTGGTANKRAIKFYANGVYWVNSYKEGAAYSLARNWDGLYASLAAPGAPAPYLVEHQGEAVGWTMDSQFYWLA